MTAAMAGLIAIAAQLQSATVRVELRDTMATVRGEYRITAAPDSVRFVLMRIDGQIVRFGDAMPPVGRDEGALVVMWPPTTGAVLTEYEVHGDVSRIPILVPDVSTDPETSEVRLEVRGYTAVAAVGDAFPRFVVEPGAIVARPENLPSVVLLPPEGGFVTNRLSSATVIVLVLGASLLWIGRQWRLRPRGQGRSQ